MNAAGAALIKRFESLRLEAYLDAAGIPTIGYGHTRGVELGMTCTPDEADTLLTADLLGIEGAVEYYIEDEPRTDNQLAAMTSLAFNIGPLNFSRSAVLRDHLAGDHASAADAFMLWTKAHVGGRFVELEGLVLRRRAERELYLT